MFMFQTFSVWLFDETFCNSTPALGFDLLNFWEVNSQGKAQFRPPWSDMFNILDG